MRSVTGYLADDGTFFDARADVELYEALHALEFSVKNCGASPEKFMAVVHGCRKQLERYLNAQHEFEKSETSGSTNGKGAGATEPPVNHHADDGDAKEPTRVLEQ